MVRHSGLNPESRVPIKTGTHFDMVPQASFDMAGKARIYLRGLATKERVKQELAGYRYVQLATHGFLDEARGMYSALVFARLDSNGNRIEDYLLHAFEVFGLRLNADLVTLSACELGLGRLRRGEGIIGLTRAFIQAGAPSVVVSLWEVDDASTSLLMRSFHQRLKDGLSKDQALQKGKIELMGSLRDPFYWAPFILVGDYRCYP